MPIKNFIKNLCTLTKNVIAGEVQEIKELVITEDDRVQGKLLAATTIATMTALGIPHTVAMQQIVEKVAAYTIRDLKDGIVRPQNLIVGRVIIEIREQRRQKALADTQPSTIDVTQFDE